MLLILFHILTNLQDSQTLQGLPFLSDMFHILTNLQDSQTMYMPLVYMRGFHILTNLQDSQTKNLLFIAGGMVSHPYKLTRLSNLKFNFRSSPSFTYRHML